MILINVNWCCTNLATIDWNVWNLLFWLALFMYLLCLKFVLILFWRTHYDASYNLSPRHQWWNCMWFSEKVIRVQWISCHCRLHLTIKIKLLMALIFQMPAVLVLVERRDLTGEAPTPARSWPPLCLSRLPVAFQPAGPSANTPPHAHWRQALPMCHMQRLLQQERQAKVRKRC